MENRKRFYEIENVAHIREEPDTKTKWWWDTKRKSNAFPFVPVQTMADKDPNYFIRHEEMRLLFNDQAEYYAVCLDCHITYSPFQWCGSTSAPNWRNESEKYLEKHLKFKGWCEFCDPIFGNGGWYIR